MISVIAWCHVLVFLRGSQVSKREEIDQKIAVYVMKQKPLLKPCSHYFWHDYNLSKHVPVAFATFLLWERVLTQKIMEKALNSLKKCLLKAWKMGRRSDTPTGENFSGALVGFPWQTEMKKVKK